MSVLGVDIGGTGIKGAIVDVETGSLLTERKRLLTPEGAKPEDVAQTTAQLVRQFSYEGAIGCGFPAPILSGVAMMAANIHESWVGKNVDDLLTQATGSRIFTLNDADAAGIAEIQFGAGRGVRGVVLIITLGTGIGTAIFSKGVLVPNAEFGHLKIRGKDAESRASDAARERKKLTWQKYARRLQEYLSQMEVLFWPELIIIGGGLSKNADKFLPYLTLRTKIMPAQFLNNAGIVGAAVFASQQLGGSAASATAAK